MLKEKSVSFSGGREDKKRGVKSPKGKKKKKL